MAIRDIFWLTSAGEPALGKCRARNPTHLLGSPQSWARAPPEPTSRRKPISMAQITPP